MILKMVGKLFICGDPGNITDVFHKKKYVRLFMVDNINDVYRSPTCSGKSYRNHEHSSNALSINDVWNTNVRLKYLSTWNISN